MSEIFSFLGFKDHPSLGMPGIIEKQSWYKINCSCLPDEGYKEEVDQNRDGLITKEEAWKYIVDTKKNKSKRFKQFLFNTISKHSKHYYAHRALALLFDGKKVDNILINYLAHNLERPSKTTKKYHALFLMIIYSFILKNNPQKLLPIFNHPNKNIQTAIIEYVSMIAKIYKPAFSANMRSWLTIAHYITNKKYDSNRNVKEAAIAAMGPPEKKLNHSSQEELLNNLPQVLRKRANWLLQNKFKPCQKSHKRLPPNCVATTSWIYFKNSILDIDKLRKFILQKGFKLIDKGSPFLQKSWNFEYNNRVVERLFDSFKPGDIILFGKFHSGIYVGKKDKEHYMFQKKNIECGDISPYEIKSINYFLNDYLINGGWRFPGFSLDSIRIYRRGI